MTRHRLDRVTTPTAAQVATARQLRRDSTPAECYAWTLLRNRRMLGLKFRRQHVLEGFIVDFYCPAQRLVLELDGAPHDNPAQAAYDRARRAWLEELGYRVVRIRNAELSPATLEDIVRTSCVPPPPSGGGGQGERMEAGRARQVSERCERGPATLCVPPPPLGGGGQGERMDGGRQGEKMDGGGQGSGRRGTWGADGGGQGERTEDGSGGGNRARQPGPGL